MTQQIINPAEFVADLLGITLTPDEVRSIRQNLEAKTEAPRPEPAPAPVFASRSEEAASNIVVPNFHKGKGRDITLLQCAAVLNLNSAGRSNVQIAVETNLDEWQIHRILDANKRKAVRRRNGNMAEVDRATIEGLARGGAPLRQIQSETGWSTTAIASVLKPLGLWDGKPLSDPRS